MENQFTMRFATTNINDVWAFAEEIERQTKLVIFWTVTAHWRGDYWLSAHIT